MADESDEVLSVHFGRSASCSSIGSVVDVLFVSGVVGTALLAALAIMLGGREPEETKEDPRRDAASAAEEPEPPDADAG